MGLLQAARTNRNARYFAEALATHPAIIRKNRVEQRRNQAAKGLLRYAECFLRLWKPAANAAEQQATRENPPPTNNFSVQQDCVGACAGGLVLLMAIESVHDVLRNRYLAPVIGDFRSRQVRVFVGAALIFAVTYQMIRFLMIHGARSRGRLSAIGCLWVALTLAFELSLGRLLGLSWRRIFSDYNPLHGGLMPLGLLLMAARTYVCVRLAGPLEINRCDSHTIRRTVLVFSQYCE